MSFDAGILKREQTSLSMALIAFVPSVYFHFSFLLFYAIVFVAIK